MSDLSIFGVLLVLFLYFLDKIGEQKFKSYNLKLAPRLHLSQTMIPDLVVVHLLGSLLRCYVQMEWVLRPLQTEQ